MTRPTNSEQYLVTSGQTLTIPSTTRGVMVACHREGTHAMTGVSIGGVALSNDATNGRATDASVGVDNHVCAWYVDDYAAFAARSSNVITFSGASVSASSDDDLYKADVFYILHATHDVVMQVDVAGTPSNSQTQPIVVALGATGAALGIVVATVEGFNYTSPFAAGQTDDYGPSLIDSQGDSVYRYGSHANITGSTNLGMNSGAGANPNGAMVAMSWIEGSALDTVFTPARRLRGEWDMHAGAELLVSEDVLFTPTTRLRGLWALHPGAELVLDEERAVVMGGYPPEGLTLAPKGTDEGDVFTWHPGALPSFDALPAPTIPPGDTVVRTLTNKSGGSVAAGDVVVIDTTNDNAFKTTTTAREEVSIGIAQATIANNASGDVLTHGLAALVNVPASVTRGHYVETHTVAKQAVGSATRRSGSFAQFTTGGTTPSAWVWGSADQTVAAGLIVRDDSGTVSVSSVDTIYVPDGTAVDLTSGDVRLRELPTGVMAASVYKSADQTNIAADTFVTVTFNTVEYDTDAIFVDASDAFVIPAGMAGKWHFGGHIGITGGSTTISVHAAIFVNGTERKRFHRGFTNEADAQLPFSEDLALAVGDVVTLRVFQSTVATTDIRGGIEWTSFQCSKIGTGNVAGLDTAIATRTGGSYTLNSTTWANVDTGMDLVIPAQAGDRLGITCGYLRSASAGAHVYMDAATIVGGSPVNYISGGNPATPHEGVASWFGPDDSVAEKAGGLFIYTVVAGDISGGNVTLRWRYRTSAASNVTVYGTATHRPFFHAVNFRAGTINRRRGTAFPTGPASGDEYYRTDIRGGMLFRYDGTRWLSDELFDTNFVTLALTATNFIGGKAFDAAGLDVWVERVDVTIAVQTTNNGSNHWIVRLYNSAIGGSLGGNNLMASSANTSAMSTSSGQDRSFAVGAVLDVSVNPALQAFGEISAGAPGTARIWGAIQWRYIGV